LNSLQEIAVAIERRERDNFTESTKYDARFVLNSCFSFENI